MIVTETYEITDAIYYDDQSTNKSSDYVVKTGSSTLSYNTGYLSITGTGSGWGGRTPLANGLSSSDGWKFECELKSSSNYLCITVAKDSSNYISLCGYPNESVIRSYDYGSNNYLFQQSSITTSKNTWYKYSMIVFNNKLYYQIKTMEDTVLLEKVIDLPSNYQNTTLYPCIVGFSDGTVVNYRKIMVKPTSVEGIDISATSEVVLANQTTTLTAKVNKTGSANQSITFTAYDSAGSVIDTSTTTTSNAGEATYTYTGNEEGEVTITVTSMGLTESYIIKDALYYDTNSYSSDTTKSLSDIPVDFKLIYTANRTSNGVAWIELGSDADNNLFGGIISDRGMVGSYSRKNGSYEKSNYSNESLTIGEHEISITVNNGDVITSAEGITSQITGSTIIARNWQKIHVTGSGSYIKDIIILPL